MAEPTRHVAFLSTLFEYSNDAQYILDRKSRRFLLVNTAFERLTGYSRADLLSGRVTADDLIVEEDRPRLAALDDPEARVEFDVYEMRTRCADGTLKNVEVSVHNVEVDGLDARIGSIRDITRRLAMERELQEQLRRERLNSTELAKANVRVYHLTERIKNAPRLAAEILKADSEEGLLSIAATAFQGTDPVGFRSIAFYLMEGERLVRQHEIGGEFPEIIDPGTDRRFGSVLRGEERYIIHRRGALVPLASQDKVLGILAVHLDSWEQELLRDAPEARDSLLDILATLATVIGLKVSNLRLHEALKHQTVIDDLTEVYNRRLLDRKAAEEFHRARRYGRSLAIILVDVDRFKEVNDTQGHQQGDVLLRSLAQLLSHRCRQEDVFCRYGGDEFVILLPETDEEVAAQKAEELRALVEAHEFPPPPPGFDPIPVRISVGVAAVADDIESVAHMFSRADEALYRAKREGRNRVATAH